MRKGLFLLIVLIGVSSLSAQENKSRAHSKALQFDYFSYTFISGNSHGIAGKYWLTNDFAMRSGISFSRESFSDTRSDVYQMGKESVNTNLKFFVQGERHLEPMKKLSPYIGGKIGIAFEWCEQDYQQNGREGLENISINWTDQSYFAGVLLGIEYWITKNITFSGYHSLDYQYGSRKNEGDFGKLESHDILSSTSCLILSFYL